MEENKFWLSVWVIAAAVLVSLIGSHAYTTALNRDKWDKAVSNGADPMVTACALGITVGGSTTADSIICNTLAQNRK
jgi:hypothetical protein